MNQDQAERGFHEKNIEALAEGYRQMAADQESEAEAEEWCEQLIGDIE